jgi:hypothetical protein
MPSTSSLYKRLQRLLAGVAQAARPAGGYGRLAFPGLPMGICLAALAATGPSLQHYALTAATGDAASIYASAYQEEIVRFPGFAGWLTGAGGALYAVAGLLAGLLACGRRSVAGTAAAAGIRFLLLVCAIDLVALGRSTADATTVVTNVLANVAGALITAGVLLAALAAARRVGPLARGSRARAVLQSTTIAATGLMFAGIAYWTFGILYRPLPAWLEVVAGLPFKGTAIHDSPKSGETAEGFDWLPAGGTIGRLSAQSVRGPLIARWKPAAGDPWRMELSVYAQCLQRDPAKLPRPAPGVAFDLARGLEITSPGLLTTVATDRHASVAVTSGRESTMFTLDLGRGSSGPDVTNLSGDDIVARVEPYETSRVALGTSLVVPKTTRTAARELLIQVPQGATAIILRPIGNDLDQRACRPTALTRLPAAVDGTERYQADVDGAMVTTLATLKRTAEPIPSLDAPTSSLELRGLSAWTTVHEAEASMLNPFPRERATELLFDGAITEFTLDGEPVAAKARNSFRAIGSIEGEWLDGRRVRLSGRVEQLWRDGRRLNATRWERTPGEMQVFLLSALGALLLLAARLLWPIIAATKDEPLEP